MALSLGCTILFVLPSRRIPDRRRSSIDDPHQVYESTSSVLQARRASIVNGIVAVPDCDLEQSNNLIKQVLQTNSRDVPMIMLYSLDEDTTTGSQVLQLRLNIGVKNDESWVPPSTNIATTDVGIVACLRRAYERRTMLVLRSSEIASEALAPLLEDVEWSGFGEPSTVLVVSPLSSAGNVLGFLIMGTNPRREFTEQCRQFITDVTLQIAAKWASAFTVEQSRVREQRLIRNLKEKERRVRYMAESAPVGMIQLTVCATDSPRFSMTHEILDYRFTCLGKPAVF